MVKTVEVPQERYAQSLSRSGFNQIAYHDRGRGTDKRTVMCVHGLSRNRHDSDALATRVFLIAGF